MVTSAASGNVRPAHDVTKVLVFGMFVPPDDAAADHAASIFRRPTQPAVPTVRVMARSDDVLPAFWDADSDYGVQQPLTDQAVRDAERLLDGTRPASLIDLLRVQDGGQVTGARNAFRTDRQTSWSEDHVPFDHVRGTTATTRAITLLSWPFWRRGSLGSTRCYLD
ncbi:hypothetical protein ACIBWG_21135 [Streptomyces griseoaurantiacus]|uniref:hypothetical protein n=1 Tax=Streptomyces griseoaurantiacus TaxID=68213 RepID=UPI0037988804